MNEVGNETNVQWLIVWVKSIPKITVIGRKLFKLLFKKVQSHVLAHIVVGYRLSTAN